jgi:hypothetical protein
MQTFKLSIEAESVDGEAVRCTTDVDIKCKESMAISVLANLLKENKDLRELIADAFLFTIKNDVVVDKISTKQYEKTTKKPTDFDNLDF